MAVFVPSGPGSGRSSEYQGGWTRLLVAGILTSMICGWAYGERRPARPPACQRVRAADLPMCAIWQRGIAGRTLTQALLPPAYHRVGPRGDRWASRNRAYAPATMQTRGWAGLPQPAPKDAAFLAFPLALLRLTGGVTGMKQFRSYFFPDFHGGENSMWWAPLRAPPLQRSRCRRRRCAPLGGVWAPLASRCRMRAN